MLTFDCADWQHIDLWVICVSSGRGDHTPSPKSIQGREGNNICSLRSLLPELEPDEHVLLQGVSSPHSFISNNLTKDLYHTTSLVKRSFEQ